MTKPFHKLSSALLLFLSLSCALQALSFTLKSSSIFLEWMIFSFNSNYITMSVILDQKSTLFLATVFMISSFILVYSIYYMEGDQNNNRFVIILLFFICSMVFLIISPNLISIMLGWDGLGLTSYALVVYYQSEYSANSGMITILSNRVGDSTIMVAIAWMLYKGSHNFTCVQNLDWAVLVLVVISSFTKSAQLPFSAWLPAAMAAPTPVSALVHSSTLVTAGVFIMIRFMPVVKVTLLPSLTLTAGLMTMLAAGWVANFETDLKKVIALSTLSQLGLMFVILGLGNEDLAFLHLIMHALFKSTLFMAAGFVIHNLNNSQEGRFANSFSVSSPVLSLVFSCTNISLCGVPFMTGFFSKDSILEQSFSDNSSNFIMSLIILSTGLTLAYSLRSVMLISTQKSYNPPASQSSDFSGKLFYSTHLLFLLSVVGGWFISWLLQPSLKIFLLSTWQKFSILTVLAVTTLLIFATVKTFFTMVNKKLSFLFYLMIFVPFMTKVPSTVMGKKIGQTSTQSMEKGWLEEAAAMNLVKKSTLSSYLINKTNLIMVMTQFVLAFFMIFLLITVNCLL
uniref:NADH-ubiquinone oxidoreductase chain 5 n=1 Tax=Caprella scaura TaxID=703580 RepID=E2RVN3_9CRUS|nr:NADH dehydrogenase subunit 5 [Caprella scaura]BAJ23207.1 NADH dehydrogenase subunit 5 [Caprella scaura]